MFIYNITLKIDWSIENDWLQWMKEEHMPEVLATGCFEKSQLLRLIEVDETDGPTFAAQYTAANREAYDRFISNHAPDLRQKSFDKWGNRFVAFRSVMEVVH